MTQEPSNSIPESLAGPARLAAESRRVSRRRFLTGGIALGGLMLVGPTFLAACSSSDSGAGDSDSTGPATTGEDSGAADSAGGPRSGGTLRMALAADALDLDPSEVGDNPSIFIVSNLFDRLYRSEADGSNQPWLASDHEISEDQLTWTFVLRDGVVFSDGSPLTAADVKFSIDRCSESDENGYMNVAIDSIEAPDDKTVVIHTNYPTDLLGVVAYFANGIVPKDLGGKSTDDFFAQPIGSGAFTLDSWNPGQTMTLLKNDNYWGPDKPYVERVEISIVGDDNSRLLQLRGGQVDVINDPPSSQVAALDKEDGIDVYLPDSTSVSMVYINHDVPELADEHVRKAMSLAIDRAAIVSTALFGVGEPAGSFFSPTWPFYDSSMTPPAQDIEGAKAEIAQSAYPDGFTMPYMFVGGDSVQSATAQLIAANLAEIGIQLDLQQFDANTVDDSIGEGEFSLAHANLSLDVMDAFEDVPYMVDPDAEGDGWAMGYDDPEVVEWSVQASQTTDPAVQEDFYHKIQQKVFDSAAFIPIYYSPYRYALSTALRDFTVPPTGDFRLEKAWLEA